MNARVISWLVAKATPPVPTVTVEVPAFSAIAVSLTASVNDAASLSVIVTVASEAPSVAFPGFVRRTVKSSLPSIRGSSRIATVKVSVVSPAAKVSVPFAAV